MDLGSIRGRFIAVLCAINLYRLFKVMHQRLPELLYREALWSDVQRGNTIVSLNPNGAEKSIADFRAHETVGWNTHWWPRQIYPVLTAHAT